MFHDKTFFSQIFESEQWRALTGTDLSGRFLQGLVPLKMQAKETIPSGQIFIGLATQQSTGIGMHIFSHLIPTIERENVDLQDPYISIWNEELLFSIGKLIRCVYDQSILRGVNTHHDQSTEKLNRLFVPFAFQTSSPNKEIGSSSVNC